MLWIYPTIYPNNAERTMDEIPINEWYKWNRNKYNLELNMAKHTHTRQLESFQYESKLE